MLRLPTLNETHVFCEMCLLPVLNARRDKLCCSLGCDKERKRLDPVKQETRRKRRHLNREVINARQRKAYHASGKYKALADSALKWRTLAETRTRNCRQCGKGFHFGFKGKLRYFCTKECFRISRRAEKRLANARNLQDPSKRLKSNVAGIVRDYLTRRRMVVGKTAWKHLGYTPDALKRHLESYFNAYNNFNWENYGELWHIDHIIPQSWFKIASMQDEEFKKAWALSNLYPVTVKYNTSKKNSFAGCFLRHGWLAIAS